MPGQRCCVCGNSRSKDPGVSFHRFPNQRMHPERRAVWLQVFGMCEEDIGPDSRVCSRHFPSGDVKHDPTMTVGKRFASPIKRGLRAERAKQREEQKQVRVQEGNVLHLSPQLHYQDQAHLLNSLTPIFKSMSFRVSSVVDAPSQSRIPLY